MGLFDKKDEKAEEQKRKREDRLRRITERDVKRAETEEDPYEEDAREEETSCSAVVPETKKAENLREDREGSTGTLPEPPAAKRKKSRKKPEESTEGLSSLMELDAESVESYGGERALLEREVSEREQKKENGVVARVRERVSGKFGDRILSDGKDPAFRHEVENAVNEFLSDEAAEVSLTEKPRIAKRIVNLILGLGPLEELFDKGYTEIMVSRWDRIFVEKNGRMSDSGVRFGSEEELEAVITQMCGRIGKTINKTQTRVDGDLEDGSRFNAIFPPSSPDGANLTIRRFSDHRIEPGEYLKFGSADERMLSFLEDMVKAGATVIASGGTGSGKTTLLNLLASFIPEDLAVLTIEDSLELNLPCPNLRRRLTRQSSEKDRAGSVSTTDLVKNALRERPDRIVIGEIRDGTMVDFLDAANSGHDGCLTTVHANSPKGLTSRVISLFKKANIEGYGTDDIKRLYADAVQLIVQIKRYPDHTRKISHISHVAGFGYTEDEKTGWRETSGDVAIRDIFRWKPDGGTDREGRLTGRFIATGYVPEALLELADDNGIRIDRGIFSEGSPQKEKEEKDG